MNWKLNNHESLKRFKEELKQKNDIVSVVSKYIPLVRKGRSFWGRCPFHGEKTPSFAVNGDDQFYHCFGCGVGGDVIKFVQEIESVDFMGAVHILADLAHMEVPAFTGTKFEENSIKQRKEEKDRLYALMKETARHYVDNLKTPPAYHALRYLEQRQISPQIARIFGIGYSQNYYEIMDHLRSKGYTLKEMETAGVIKYRDGKPFDAMNGRVVFPILDTSFNVIGFSGRMLDSKPHFAKYLNTSDTILFNKSKSLFAINMVKKAKMASAKLDPIIVVEGHMDVVSLHKAGFTTAVASMGTALTTEQAKLIKRFTDKVYICYDGDSAGKKATLRGLDILKDTGLDVYVMSMPEGLDPDDVIKKFGADGYRKLIEQALPLVDYKLEFLKKLYDVSTPEGKTKYLNEALEILNGLDEIEREVYIAKVSDISGIMKDFIKRQLETRPKIENDSTKKINTLSMKSEVVETRKKAPTDTKVVQAEKFILSAILHRRPYAHFDKDVSCFFTEGRDEFYKVIKELILTANEKEITKLFYERFCQQDNDQLEEESFVEKSEQASEIINYIYKNTSEENDLNYYKDCVFLVYKNYAEQKISELTKLLESAIEKEKRNELLMEIKRLSFNIKNKKVEL